MNAASLARRDRRPELMDQPGLQPEAHRRALEGLRRLNLWAGSARILRRPIARLAARERRPLGVLDVACGAGDLPLALAQWSRRGGPALTLTGCDRSPVAVEHAGQAARRAGLPVTFVCADALGGALPLSADVVTCSLFLHHLDEGEAVELLGRLGAAARRLLLVADLRRGALGFGLAWTAARALSRSPIVHYDAPASVRAAFTPAEALALAQRAGLQGARVERVWPQRWLLSWWRP